MCHICFALLARQTQTQSQQFPMKPTIQKYSNIFNPVIKYLASLKTQHNNKIYLLQAKVVWIRLAQCSTAEKCPPLESSRLVERTALLPF